MSDIRATGVGIGTGDAVRFHSRITFSVVRYHMAMSEVAQQGDGGDFHFEIKFVDESWQWVVSQKDRGRIGSGHGITREDAKAAAITIAGRAPDEWIDLTPNALNS